MGFLGHPFQIVWFILYSQKLASSQIDSSKERSNHPIWIDFGGYGEKDLCVFQSGQCHNTWIVIGLD